MREFDLLIKNATVVDGSGAASFVADIGVTGDVITALGQIDAATAAQTVDASGRIAAPGFIDTHIHSEIALLGFGHRFGGVLQGVTTQFTAPDGFGWAGLPEAQARELWDTTAFCYGVEGPPLGWPTPSAYLDLFPGATPANVVPQAPHCAIRLGVMGWAGRPATSTETDAQAGILREWMEAGAVGLAIGLDYQPSAFASTEELIELTRVAGDYGGVYNAHIRNNLLGRAGAWQETIQIGREAGSRVHVAHEYVDDTTAPLLEQAEREVDLTFESYMYPAGSTHFPQFDLPAWAEEGGDKGLRQRLRDDAVRDRLRLYLNERLADNYGTGAKQVIGANGSGRYIGMTIAEAAALGSESLGEFALRMIDEEPFTLTVNHRTGSEAAHEQMIRRTASHPLMIVASDGIYHGQHPHPRAFGCQARVLRLCVRERGHLSLEAAVHKMTGYPAERFNVRRRGRITEGHHADLVILDADKVADRSTWEQPLLEPVGIDQVFVNGVSVVERGQPTGALPGQVAVRDGSR